MDYKDKKVDKYIEDWVEQLKKEFEDLMNEFQEKRFELDKIKNKNLFEISQEIKKWEEIKCGVIEMAKERQRGFPWLAKAYDELFLLQDTIVEDYLKYKNFRAEKSSELVKMANQYRRLAERKSKIAQYLVEYYESICPFLIDLKEDDVDLADEENDESLYCEYNEEEKVDEVIKYLTVEEYRKLPSIEKNQIALDRFWSRPKSKRLIGKLYERYIGQIYEEKGYNVDYVGIFKGLEDLGRDLICKNKNETIIIQCKNWSKFKTIYEKHIFQFFGTVFEYKDKNPSEKVKAVFYTSTKLSDLARRFSKELGIELKENFKFSTKYPSIKCNISTLDGNKIYHLPFDQQYDRTKIEKYKGEFYCTTVKEAEEAGFRRAFRHRVAGGD